MIETAPRFTPEQTALFLALAEYEDGCCPGCGGHLQETTAPEAEFLYRDEDPVRCHKCAALSRVKRKWGNLDEVQQDGLLYSAGRR